VRLPGPAVAGGVVELVTGADDLDRECRYWESFGFEVTEVGVLEGDRALEVYGWGSAVESSRLRHRRSGHGGVRLMHWERQRGPGLGLAPLKALGSVWGSSMARLARVMVHAALAKSQGMELALVEPVIQQIYPSGDPPAAFGGSWPCVLEMAVLRPCARHVLFERVDYCLSGYGAPDRSSPMRASQLTHVGLTVGLEQLEAIDFYEAALGLRRMTPAGGATRYGFGHPGPQKMFDLDEGESYLAVDFDDPRSTPSRPISGRLKVILLDSKRPLDFRLERHLGCLGPVAPAWPCEDPKVLAGRAVSMGATQLGEGTDEFGRHSAALQAPDGTVFLLCSPGRP